MTWLTLLFANEQNDMPKRRSVWSVGYRVLGALRDCQSPNGGEQRTVLQLFVESRECRYLSPGTPQVYDLNHKFAYGGVVVTHTSNLIPRSHPNAFECFGNRHRSACPSSHTLASVLIYFGEDIRD